MERSDAPAVAGIDITRPSAARMYDYALGGKENYQVDREAVDKIAAIAPELWDIARENRAFLRRAVRYMARQGIHQFLDIGSGLPTAGNTHEAARQVTPDARVVYVDNDPVVLVHGKALLATDHKTAVVSGDMRRPSEVLRHPDTVKLIDFDAPIGVLMIAMAHFLTAGEYLQIMGRLRDVLPAGSHLAVTHLTSDDRPANVMAETEAIYASTSTPVFFRTHAEILKIFEGFDLLAPGLVTVDAWHPDPDDPAPAPTRWLHGGVGRKN